MAPSIAPPSRAAVGSGATNNLSISERCVNRFTHPRDLHCGGVGRDRRSPESDRRHCRIRLHRSRTLVISVPFRLRRPASTSGTRSSNPLSSSGESRANLISSIRAPKSAKRDDATRLHASGTLSHCVSDIVCSPECASCAFEPHCGSDPCETASNRDPARF
jgi:hypothetical protein